MIYEACVGSIEEAILAKKKGANRIELCDNLEEGGTTPSYGTIKICKEVLDIPIACMIRPRGGDFNYTKEEIKAMIEDIKVCKELKVEAVVFGVLKKDKSLDIENMKLLCENAKPLKIVFHKAIDEMSNPLEIIDTLYELGVNRILTSGTKNTAFEGKDILNELIQACNNKMKIVVAGKVTKDNIENLSKLINSNEFHGKKIV
ncbi:copper homeostasis protein CutC [Sneathia sanguinegens]|uniref:PF03932 family protein CutC n=1 Tax=Sneathia sanguinegens TaxID=40543 RepID=A0ABT7HJL5_9FUSO|nr:copper homeostasis protein CutC [Sneathia sanguinegens]MDK9580726.1 copper homeostasis protein CutC [Sneathia sanguinegens]